VQSTMGDGRTAALDFKAFLLKRGIEGL